MAACVRCSFGIRANVVKVFQRSSLNHKYLQSRVLAVQQRSITQINQDYEVPHSESSTTQERSSSDVLYKGHIPTTPVQRGLLAVGSAIMCLYNPSRDDMICALGESTGYYALKSIRNNMLHDPEGKIILQEQPLINTETVNLEYLGALPEDTFGKAYWHFLQKHGFSPDARLPVHFIDDPELVYVMLRYRQIHDLMHTLLGMPPNMLGEVVVKWVEAIQTGLPMCVLASLFGPLRLGPKHRQKYLDTYLPWAIRCGRNARILINVYFEKHWDKKLADLRRELNVEPAPVSLVRTGKTTLM